MDWKESAVLGVVQGLTEYLPVSSSGHLAAGAEIMGINNPDDNLLFTVLVHAATACSSIIIFRKEISSIIRDLFKFRWNEGTKYFCMLLLSAIPVAVIGLFFKDKVEAIFGSGMLLIGIMWLLTAVLLFLPQWIKAKTEKMSFPKAVLVGLGQVVAILPGVSRSGTTLSVGLLLKVKPEEIAKFSFLMVIAPILGEALLDVKSIASGEVVLQGTSATVLVVGFLAAFLTGLFACNAMLSIVKKGKLHYFSIYCAVIGVLAILWGAGIFS